MQVQVTPVQSTRGEIRYLIWIPKDVAPMVGDFVRAEGTLERGLVLHCKAPARRGVSFCVQNNPKSTMIHVELPPQFGNADGPKIRTLVNAESTTVDGETVIVLDRTTPRDWANRVKRHTRPGVRSKKVAAQIDIALASLEDNDIQALKAAMQILKLRVHDAALAKAILTVAHGWAAHHVSLGWNGTELTAQIIQSL